MRKSQGYLRQAVWVGFVLAGLVLALAVPAVAFGATTVSFVGRTPTGATTDRQPNLSVTVWELNGVSGLSNRTLTLDGNPLYPNIRYYAGWGYRMFDVWYKVHWDLSFGTHTVAVWIRDVKGLTFSTSWTFTVTGPPDTVAPSTSSDVLPTYVAPAVIHLSATDNPGGSGVAHTYYIVDGGPQTEGTVVTVSAVGLHNLKYWSVDKAGNVETQHVVSFAVTIFDITPPVTTSDATSTYRGSAMIHLSATDNPGGSGVAHTYYTLDGGPQTESPWVQTAVLGAHTLKFWSVDAVGNTEAKHTVTFTVIDVHTLTIVVGCTDGTCHQATDLVALHKNNCSDCHTGGTPPATCTNSACHGTANPHPNINNDHTTTRTDCAKAGCHSTDVRTIHTTVISNGADPAPGCAACHANGVTASLDCSICHADFATIHPAGDHAVNGPCYSSMCHASTDIGAIHTNGDDPPGCAACHGAGKTPTLGCFSCHPNLVEVHSFVHVDASGTKSTACTACHGTDLPTVHATLGCFCHTESDVRGDMTPLLAAGTGECVDCHSGTDAAHWFASTSSTPTVSGHNTTTYGTVGARTDFSSLGITDTVGVAPSAQFPLTVNNTFKPGYSWTSFVTCEDCHTGLKGNEPAGPHGGFDFSATAGIDPAYPGSFESASLWGGTYAKKLANGTTYTVGPFAEGIAQWANTSADPEGLAGYQVVTPNMSDATTTSVVVGPASVTAGNVICVKCHDLYDSTKATGFKGWGNYAHEHHSADTGSFSMYFGKYTVKTDSDNTSHTVAAESMAAAKTSVVASYGGSVVASAQVLAASLGREDAGACRNCHIAIPHGWKRPKLIVYSNLPDPTAGYRASLNLPATGDSLPYNIGPAVYEGEGLNGTGLGSGQMNGLASGIVHVQEAQKTLASLWVTAGTLPANLAIEEEDYPALVEVNQNPLNGFTGDEYVNWSTAQCNACGHHSTTSFNNPTATQPPIAWNSRENNWVGTKPANGAWK